MSVERWLVAHPPSITRAPEPLAPPASFAHIPQDMWLYPVMPTISALAARAYYRLTVSGSLPLSRPVLLVANHSNSLMDPALMVVAARRTVRLDRKSTRLNSSHT